MHGKKLELQWANKNKSLYYDASTGNYEWVNKKDPHVSEPRILIEKGSYGNGASNLLIKGDNLLALKALLPDFQNKVNLIYIDPPFNTGSAFTYYDDGLENSIWLTMMRDRLELLHTLLIANGLIYVHIDSRQFAHLKIVMDEIFGEKNFLSFITLEVKDPAGVGQQSYIFDVAEYILVYAKDFTTLKESNKLERISETEGEGIIKNYNKAIP